MASIHKNVALDASAADVWAAVRDFGALHTRLVPGFVLDTKRDGDARIVSFANGTVAREVLVDCDDARQRLVYAVKSERVAKSVATEHTFSENLTSEIFMLEKLETTAAELERRLKRYNVAGKTVTLKIKYSDFTLQTRSKTLPYYISDKSLLFDTAKELLLQEKMKESVRLLGISLSNLNTEEKKTVAVQLKFDF